MARISGRHRPAAATNLANTSEKEEWNQAMRHGRLL